MPWHLALELHALQSWSSMWREGVEPIQYQYNGHNGHKRLRDCGSGIFRIRDLLSSMRERAWSPYNQSKIQLPLALARGGVDLPVVEAHTVAHSGIMARPGHFGRKPWRIWPRVVNLAVNWSLDNTIAAHGVASCIRLSLQGSPTNSAWKRWLLSLGGFRLEHLLNF